MAMLLDQDSFLGTKSELDLFSVPPTQVAIEKGSWYECYPKNTVTREGPYEFEITPDPLYLDLNRNYLHMVLSITKRDGSALAQATDIGFINLIGKTFFQRCKIWLNSTLAFDSSDTYAYRAYLETVLNYGSDAKETHLQAGMYFRDQASRMETVENDGHKSRVEYSKLSRHVELMAPVHSDLFNQDRFLLNNMNVRLELHRNSDEFCLMGFANDVPDVKINVVSIMWYVRKIEVLSSMALGIEAQLNRNVAKYPIRRVVVKTMQILGGRRDSPHNVLFSGQIPRRMVIGCLDKDAFYGKVKKNPFNFKNFNIRQISVSAGGVTYPRNPMILDFQNKRYTRAYLSLFEAINTANEDKGNKITYSNFLSGYTLFGFDLSPDHSDGDYWQLIRDGSTSIRIEFGADTPEDGIRVIVLAEFDNLLTIDRFRNVYMDFTA